MNSKIFRYLPAFLWFLLSFYLLTLPGSRFPKMNWFDKMQGDKLIHIGMFAVLVGLALFPQKKLWILPSYLRTAVLVATCALAYGITMEFVQENFIPNRSFDVWDMVADGIGSFLPVAYLKFNIIKRPVAG